HQLDSELIVALPRLCLYGVRRQLASDVLGQIGQSGGGYHGQLGLIKRLERHLLTAGHEHAWFRLAVEDVVANRFVTKGRVIYGTNRRHRNIGMRSTAR